MPVIGIVIREIYGTKKEELGPEIRVNNNATIKDLKQTELIALNKDGLSVSFEFKASYESQKSKKSLAEITIAGDVLLIEPDQAKILKQWNKDKKLPEDLNIQVINTILRKCITKSLSLSEDLNLPPPIGLPVVAPKKGGQAHEESSRYIG
ncbi:MAG TPA: hypothetical protein VJH90_01990 [archaeon]|nr:hypothetical protein [archaeon]